MLKPEIEVRCLPSNLTEDDIQRLRNEIVKVFVSVLPLGITHENEMIVFLTPDMMKDGLVKNIIMKVTTRMGGASQETKEHLGKSLVNLMKKRFPGAYISCDIRRFDPINEFHWDSEKG